VPFVECFEFVENGATLRAYWGYTNTTGATIPVPDVGSNLFSPAPANRGQPIGFPPGSPFHRVFSTTSPFGIVLNWFLDGQIATLDQTVTPQCPTGSGLTWLGPWDSTFPYSPGDAVNYQGSSWVALQENVNSPPVEGDDWTLLAQQGEPGPAGPPGPSGTLILLPQGAATPAGYTLLGTTVVIVKKPGGGIATLTTNVFQKN
jgi:hypothetical protein